MRNLKSISLNNCGLILLCVFRLDVCYNITIVYFWWKHLNLNLKPKKVIELIFCNLQNFICNVNILIKKIKY